MPRTRTHQEVEGNGETDVRISNMNDLVTVLIDEINLLRKDKITPSRANAMANLNGKILQAVKVSVEAQKYVQRLDKSGSQVPLIPLAQRSATQPKHN